MTCIKTADGRYFAPMNMQSELRLSRPLAVALTTILMVACASSGTRPSTPSAPAAPISPAKAIHAPAAPPAASTHATARTAASKTAVPIDLAARINAFIAQPRFRHADWGIEVSELDTGHSVYSHRADKLFVPASNSKLFTAALALDVLGPDTRFATSLVSVGAARRGSTLQGDLVLRGGGDPALGDVQVAPETADWAARMAEALHKLGISRIEGDLIGDATFYATPEYGNGWEADDLQASYAPPVSALTSAGNVMAVTVREHRKQCCRIDVWPDVLKDSILDRMNKDPALQYRSLSVFRRPGHETVWVTGSMPAGQQSRRFVLSAGDPARLAALRLRKALSGHGIVVQGRVRSRYWPQPSALESGKPVTVLVRVSSPPVHKLVRHMLKESDNLYAQMLLLNVGQRLARSGTCADRLRPPATAEQWGLCAMRDLLRRIGIDPSQASFSEGSGLSRRTLVSPQAVTDLLRWVTQQRFAPDFIDALPIAGVDGTLKRRLRESLAAGALRAKTGTLTHVYALSGYTTTADDTPLVFSLLLNHYQRPRDAFNRRLPPSPTHDLDAIVGMLVGDVPAQPAIEPSATEAVSPR